MSKFALSILAGVASMALAVPASAAVTINTGVGAPVTLTAGGAGTTITFNGQENGTVFPGVSSTLTIALTTQTANSSVFSYSLSDTGSISRVSAFGFSVDPNVTSASSTGTFGNTALNSQISSGTNVEVCLFSGPQCSGGGNTGVANGGTQSGTFTLNFSGNGSNITLANFIDRYQAVAANNGGSAVGVPVGAVPEPATWAMMLIGFGATGFAMRRRKQPTLQAA